MNPRVSLARHRAIRWLDRNLNLLENKGSPYEIAIVTYALMKAKAASSEHAFTLLAKYATEIGKHQLYFNFITKIQLP